MIYLTWAAFFGKVAGPNPWPATGLEWQTASPPPTENFEVTPVVTWEPYDFHNRPDLGLDVGSTRPGTHVTNPAPAHGDD
jgi:heme/copper-type cytochrome/quinol oxidase subunit 1